MAQERQLQQSGELREGSNFGRGQMVAADFTMRPSVQFSGRTGGGGGSRSPAQGAPRVSAKKSSIIA